MSPDIEPPGLIVALDLGDLAEAESVAEVVSRPGVALKVGLTLFAAYGPEAVRRIGRHGRVFCDLKLHDIPHQVGLTAAQISALGVWMLSVHASGGSSMIRRAAEGLRGAPAGSPSILGAVTVLTSLSPGDLEAVGQGADAPAQVLRLAKLATQAGAGAIICSPHELSLLRKVLGPDVVLVSPGVRPAGSPGGDQARVTTPGEAARAGADYVVVGRPITEAKDPAEATDRILHELRYARS